MLQYQRVYYTGQRLLHPSAVLHYEVRADRVPSFGWCGAVVFSPNQEGRRSKSERLTLFCPFTLTANQVTATAGEICRVGVDPKGNPIAVRDEAEALEPLSPRGERIAGLIELNWRLRCKLGLQADYDVAAAVLRELRHEVPDVRPETGGEERPAHGKPAADRLLRPVSPDTKRGRVMAFFLRGGQSVLAAMAEFGSTRSGILTHLHGLAGDHGVGYSIQGDVVTLTVPEERMDADDILGPEPDKAEPKAKKFKGKELDPLGEHKLPEKGKRREVALATISLFDLVDVKTVAEKVGCSEASVRSHLNDLHTKHGFGFEYSDDRSAVRLLVPDGWTP